MIIDIGTEIDESVIRWKHKETDEWTRADIDELIEAYESIVRCKDCIWGSDWNGVYNHDTELFCYLHECGMDNDDFCSRAKMKGDAE